MESVRPVRTMSEDVTSSGDEGALRIDTERKSTGEKGRVKGKGRAKGGRGAAPKNGQQEPAGNSVKPGDVVWAKVMGFKFWPAKIFDAVNDDVVPGWLKLPPKPAYMLVRFFGTYDMQWVSPNSIETYDKGLTKRFHSKSRSKVFQKAVKEVFAYKEDSVMPEGLTLRPPDPPIFSGDEAGNDDQVPSSSLPTASVVDPASNNGPTHTRGSSRRKSSTPRRLSSSSSDSAVKRPRLNSTGEEEGRGLPLSPEIQAFTCAPLPLIAPSAEPVKAQTET